MSRSVAQGGNARAVPDLRIDAARTEALADAVPASLAQVLREIGWLLVRRAQLAKEGRPVCECLPLLQPLAKACRTYAETMEQLRDQLMVADAVLEHLLDGTEPAPGAADAAAAPIAPLDLYSVMSTLPAMGWDSAAAEGAAPGAQPASAAPAPDVPMASIDAALAQAMPVTEAPRAGTSASDAIAIDSDSDSDGEPVQASVQTAAPGVSGPDRQPGAPPGDDLVSALLSAPLPAAGAAEASGSSAPETQAAPPEKASATDARGEASALDFSWLDLESLGGAGDMLGLGSDGLPEAGGLAGLDLGTLQDLT